MAGSAPLKSQGRPSPRAVPASMTSHSEKAALDAGCSRILHWLNPEQLVKLRAAASIEHVRARTLIAPDDQHLRFLVTGAVRCSYTDQGCRRRLSNFLGPGDMVQNPFFCSPGTFRVFETMTDCTLLCIPVEPFAEAIVGVSWKEFSQSVTAILSTTFSLLALNTRLRGVLSRCFQIMENAPSPGR
jgi:CRP-like cAMP-binding protein